MATAIFCGDSCAWAPVFTKPGGLFARPLRSNRTGHTLEVQACKRLVEVAVEEASYLRQHCLSHDGVFQTSTFPGFNEGASGFLHIPDLRVPLGQSQVGSQHKDVGFMQKTFPIFFGAFALGPSILHRQRRLRQHRCLW